MTRLHLNALSLLSLMLCISVNALGPVGSIPMKVVNNAGFPIELFWVNIFNHSLKYPANFVSQSPKPLRNSSNIQLNSFHTHKFVVRLLKHAEGCEVFFTKGPAEEVITIGYDTVAKKLTVKQMTKFDEIMDKMKACNGLPNEEFEKCVAVFYMDDVKKLTESKAQLANYRNLISSRLRDYSCGDPKMKSTAPLSTTVMWSGGKKIMVDTLLDTPRAKIWKSDEFITADECKILMDHGRPRLSRAEIVMEDGSSVVSDSRKAQHATYYMDERDPTNDPLFPLFQRVLDITNQKTGYKLQYPGQESFTIIQYNKADQYTPHCDGICDGSHHIPHGRVATAVLYCKVADLGGATTFTKSDIFVKPTNGSASFFSYKGLDGRMDEGYTEHSGCPVLEGEKWITTMWMREGVTREEPSYLFDPLGIPLMSETIAANTQSAHEQR